MSKKLFLVVDMQNDFVSGVFGSEAARAIVPKVKELCEVASKESNTDIIFTMDTHINGKKNSNECIVLPPHCIKGTYGHLIIEDLFPYVKQENVIEKGDFMLDPYNTQFDEKRGAFSLSYDYDEIEICGLCTDICVVSNALWLRKRYPNAEITILQDACAGTTPAKHKAALDVMNSCLINIK